MEIIGCSLARDWLSRLRLTYFLQTSLSLMFQTAVLRWNLNEILNVCEGYTSKCIPLVFPPNLCWPAVPFHCIVPFNVLIWCIILISFTFCLCEGKENQCVNQYKLSVTILDFVLVMLLVCSEQWDFTHQLCSEWNSSILQRAYFFVKNCMWNKYVLYNAKHFNMLHCKKIIYI